MTTFCDASAIVKQYVDERGSRSMATLGERLVVSDLSAVEVPSAIWRKHRSGEVSASDASVLVSAFAFDLRGGTYQSPRYAAIELRPAVLAQAADLLPRHDLRAGDAVQLASAIAARTTLEFCDSFATFDSRLRVAVAAEGFVVVPSESDLEET